MKRILCVLTCILLLGLFCACREEPVAEAPALDVTVSITAAPTAEVIDATVKPTSAPPTPSPTPTETPSPTPTEEPTPTPEPTPSPTPRPPTVRDDLTGSCKFQCTQSGVSKKLLTDNNLKSSIIFANNVKITYSWKDDVPADVLYFFTYTAPDSFRITQMDGAGEILSEEDYVPERMCCMVPLMEGCRSVTLQCNGRCKINAMQIFGAGDVFPSRTVWWTEVQPDSYCDMMMVSTHFDDEILMMGGVMPIYAGDQGKDCMVVYMKGQDEIRKMEAMQGLWEMGVRREAIYLDCTSDSLQEALDNDAAGIFRKDDLCLLVSLIRQYRPLVVVTQDVNGEYGHESHVKTSALVRRAVELAADPNYDPDSAAEYGVWQVQKEYIHLWPENALELDIQSPLKNMGGRSAYQVAKAAFDYHKSQQPKWSLSATHKKFPIGNYGLYFSAVGPDSGINDMFENVVEPNK